MAGQKRAQDEPGPELSGLAQISDELTGAGIIAIARAFGRDHDVGALAASRVTRSARSAQSQEREVTNADSARAVASTSALRSAGRSCRRESSASRTSPSKPKRSMILSVEKSAISAPGLTASAISASREPISASAA